MLGGLGALVAGGVLTLRKLFRRGREGAMSLWKKLLITAGVATVGGVVLNESLKYNQVRSRLSAMTGATRDTFEGVLNGKVEAEILKARNRDGLPPEQYHQSMLFTPPVPPRSGTEKPGQHRLRAHLVPGDRPRPLTVIIGGNDERLYDPNPGDDPNLIFGSRHVFEELAARNTGHVVQLNVGRELSRDPRLNNAVAREHIRNIVADATRSRGIFQGCACSEIRFVGYSYGAGVIQELTAPGQDVVSPDVPVGATAYVEGVQFRSVPPVSLKEQPPSSRRHLHVWQANSERAAGFASGAPLIAPRPQDQQLDVTGRITGSGHIALTGAHREDIRREVYGPVLDWLER